MRGITRRRAITLLALVGVFLSTYLFLYSLGYYGGLACGPGGGCSVVQASRYAEFLGFSVAGWGVAWYVAVLTAAFTATQTRWRGERWVSAVLLALAAGGLVFTAYLKFVEFFVIRAVCRWCVGSAVLVLAIFLLSLPEWRTLRSGGTRTG